MIKIFKKFFDFSGKQKKRFYTSNEDNGYCHST